LAGTLGLDSRVARSEAVFAAFWTTRFVRRASKVGGWVDLYAIGAYRAAMEFIETPTFTRLVTALLADEEYRALQNELLEDPERGDLIRGGGGIRKLRFALPGRGKRGGVRVIYYWAKDRYQVYFLVVYPKSRKDDLSDKETAILRELVKGL
jgi:hypothetical protein